MAGIDNSLSLGVGHISYDRNLGAYYQDISSSIVHITQGIFAALDSNGIPYYIEGNEKIYSPIVTIQYALASYDLLLMDDENSSLNKERFINSINWLESKCISFSNSLFIPNPTDKKYSLAEGWFSGMVQGQALSAFLRAYQLTNNEKYLQISEKLFASFFVDYKDGGFSRLDNKGFIWFEEYRTEEPSLVLNGFLYAMFGVLDYFRATENNEAKKLWDSSVHTLEVNLNKYDVWYWSIYDQLKKQLVTYYYQKNVHIPLMQIMFQLTKKEIFNKYAVKWEKNLNSQLHKFVVKIMYRIQPRIKKLIKKTKQ